MGEGNRSAEWEHLRHQAMGCRACPLWENATQTVFGEGSVDARLALVGEQPGDNEDLSGEPFVGPAGRLLDEVLEEVGIDRRQVYVTNAVKHFKWSARGKRRIHEKPNRSETVACRPWLEQEMALVRPAMLVALGATAAQSVLGPSFRLTQHHGEMFDGTGLADAVMATIHPSAVLRAPAERREPSRRQLAADLAQAADWLRCNPNVGEASAPAEG